jgi:hypothetical protein
MPVERTWPTKAERIRGAGGVIHEWEANRVGADAAARQDRAGKPLPFIDSRRTALSKASPVPSLAGPTRRAYGPACYGPATDQHLNAGADRQKGKSGLMLPFPYLGYRGA